MKKTTLNVTKNALLLFTLLTSCALQAFEDGNDTTQSNTPSSNTSSATCSLENPASCPPKSKGCTSNDPTVCPNTSFLEEMLRKFNLLIDTGTKR